MNLKQARMKLDIVNKFTVSRSADIPIIISELCDVVEFLLDEIGRIKSPPITLLQQLPMGENPSEPVDQRPDPTPPPPLPNKPYVPPTTTDRIMEK